LSNPTAMFDAFDSVEALMNAGIDVSALGFPLELLSKGREMADTVTSALSFISGLLP
jgi:hypothetical protein